MSGKPAQKMRLIKPCIRLVCILTLLFSISGMAEEAYKSITITTGEWSPFISQSLPGGGPVTNIVRSAFELEGISVSFVFLPWGRAMAEAKSGKYDASAIWYFHKDRTPYFQQSDAVFLNTTYFIHRKGEAFKWEAWSDLKGLILGGVVAYTHTKLLQQHQLEGGYELHIVTSEETNMRKLLKGRINSFPISKGVAFYLLATHFPKGAMNKLSFYPKPMDMAELFLLFSNKSNKTKQLLPIFNRGLRKLKLSGDYESMMHEFKHKSSSNEL